MQQFIVALPKHRATVPSPGSVVKFSTDAFSKPLLYLNSEEDSDTVQRYKHYMEGNDGGELQADFKVNTVQSHPIQHFSLVLGRWTDAIQVLSASQWCDRVYHINVSVHHWAHNVVYFFI